MVTILKTQVIEAKCGTCGMVYTGEYALAQAVRCERQGLPNHKYQLGTTFKIRQPRGFVSTYEVVKLLPGRYSHSPCYEMRTQSGYKTVLNERKLAYYLQNSIV